MTFDDLITVWRSQDDAPLHDVNRTLLHLALRDDDAALQRERRRDQWMLYVFSVACLVGMALILAPMVYFGRATAWDVVLAAGGAASAFFTMRTVYVNHRARSRREERYGDSLRDQVSRRIAQLHDQATDGSRANTIATVMMGSVCPTAIVMLIWRINQKPWSDDGYMIVTLIVASIWTVATMVWQHRRYVHRNVLPRKQRLEELLRQLDVP